MNFTVEAEPDAEDDLAAIWFAAADAIAVTRASAETDRLLRLTLSAMAAISPRDFGL
jgi:hypothetical protein